MKPIRRRLEFFLGADPVGQFRGRGYPISPGRNEYFPYRGMGHAVLALALKSGVHPECWYLRKRQRVHFKVTRDELELGRPGSSSNWYLVISEFVSGDLEHPLGEFVGKFKDDPLIEEWKQSMKAYRKKRDKHADKP